MTLKIPKWVTIMPKWATKTFKLATCWLIFVDKNVALLMPKLFYWLFLANKKCRHFGFMKSTPSLANNSYHGAWVAGLISPTTETPRELREPRQVKSIGTIGNLSLAIQYNRKLWKITVHVIMFPKQNTLLYKFSYKM